VKHHLVSIRRRKLLKGILFLQDNGSLHEGAITHQKLADLHFDDPKNSACSPDLAPADYYLFRIRKKLLHGRKSESL
jgi:hypothetical protein